MTHTALKALIQDVIKFFDCFDELCIDVQWIVDYGDFKVARLQPYARIGTLVVDERYEMVIQEPKEQTAHAIDEAIAMNKKTISDIIASIKQKFNYTRVKFTTHGGKKMTAKEFLTQAYRIEDRITSLKRQLEAIYSPKCQTYNNIGGKCSENVSITEQQGIKAIELEKKLRIEIERLEGVQLDIYNAIEGLDNVNEQLVLRYRYIELTHDGKQPSWEIVAYKMHYSTIQTIRLHGKALEHLKF